MSTRTEKPQCYSGNISCLRTDKSDGHAVERCRWILACLPERNINPVDLFDAVVAPVDTETVVLWGVPDAEAISTRCEG